MSRTNHHRNQRGLKWGWDLWSRRGDMGMSMHNSFNRKQTIKRERRMLREEIHKIGSGSGE